MRRVEGRAFRFAFFVITGPCFAMCRSFSQLDETTVRKKGREITSLCASADDKAILSRSTPDVVKALNGRLKSVLDGIKAEAPIGKRLSETINWPHYVATHQYGGREIVITVTFE